MSRVGNMPIAVPAGVEVKLEDHLVHVKGPKGELEREIPGDISVRIEDGQILVERPSDNRIHRSLHGLSRSLVANMVPKGDLRSALSMQSVAVHVGAIAGPARRAGVPNPGVLASHQDGARSR